MISGSMSFGQVLRKFREKRGLRSKFVAERMCMTPQTYSNLENGRKKFHLHDLDTLAEILSVPKDIMYVAAHIVEPDRRDKVITEYLEGL